MTNIRLTDEAKSAILNGELQGDEKTGMLFFDRVELIPLAEDTYQATLFQKDIVIICCELALLPGNEVNIFARLRMDGYKEKRLCDLTDQEICYLLAMQLGVNHVTKFNLADHYFYYADGIKFDPVNNWSQCGPLIVKYWSKIVSELNAWYGSKWPDKVEPGIKREFMMRSIETLPHGMVRFPSLMEDDNG